MPVKPKRSARTSKAIAEFEIEETTTKKKKKDEPRVFAELPPEPVEGEPPHFAELRENELLKDVECYACKMRGGKRVISTHTRKGDGAIVRVAICKRSGCGYATKIVQMPDEAPKQAPVEQQPPVSPMSRQGKADADAELAAATARAHVEAAGVAGAGLDLKALTEAIADGVAAGLARGGKQSGE